MDNSDNMNSRVDPTTMGLPILDRPIHPSRNHAHRASGHRHKRAKHSKAARRKLPSKCKYLFSCQFTVYAHYFKLSQRIYSFFEGEIFAELSLFPFPFIARRQHSLSAVHASAMPPEMLSQVCFEFLPLFRCQLCFDLLHRFYAGHVEICL